MGGTCGVVVRKADGTVLPMARHTGVLSSLIMSLSFLRGEEEVAINEFCGKFNEMRADFLENKETKKFNLPMSTVYGWCDEKIPVEYGLVVFDFKMRKVHSAQRYGFVLGEPLSKFSGTGSEDHKSMLSTAIDEKLVDVMDSETNKIYTLEEYFGPHAASGENVRCFMNNKIKIDRNKEKQEPKLKIKATLTFEDLNDFSFFSSYFVPAQHSNMMGCNYEESLEGFSILFNHLKQDGFVFTESEVKQWANFTANYTKNYEVKPNLANIFSTTSAAAQHNLR